MAARVAGEIRPPSFAASSVSEVVQSFSLSNRVPSMSKATARSCFTCSPPRSLCTWSRWRAPTCLLAVGSDGKVLRFRVVHHERRGGLLGVQLELLRQADPDPGRVEQLHQLLLVLQVRA